MSEPEELITDAARHATVFARDLWRRHRGSGEARRPGLADFAPRLDLLITAVFGEERRIRVAQAPAPPTLLMHAFRGDRGPRATRAVPATDGASIWLPATLQSDDDSNDASDDDRSVEPCYRAMALAQAMRARRGSAARFATLPPGLVADIYLLLEAYAADHALAAMLPGLAAPIDRLRRAAFERRPPLDRFPAHRRPLERLVRELLESRCGRPIDLALVSAEPAGPAALASRIAAELSATTGTHRFGAEPLLKDWWTGALHPPPAADGREALPGGPHEFDCNDAAEPKVARLRRSPQRRDALDGEDDDDDIGLVAVQQDDPHPHAEDPMGLKRPVDRDDDASAEQLADMLSDLPEARTVATPAPPKEVLLSDDPPDARARLGLDDGAASAESCIR